MYFKLLRRHHFKQKDLFQREVMQKSNIVVQILNNFSSFFLSQILIITLLFNVWGGGKCDCNTISFHQILDVETLN